MRDHAGEVTPEEYAEIDRVLDAENLAELYEPWISDPVKYTFRQYGQGAEDEKAALARYRKTWLSMLTKYPLTYVEAFFAGNVSYYTFAPKLEGETYNQQAGNRLVFETYELGEDPRFLHTEQIAALTHDLKTPLSIIQGNADLLAEDALSADQQTQVEAILRGTDRAQQYLAALRTACAPPATGETFPSHTLVSALAETARALCAPAGVQFILNEQWQGTLCAAQGDLLRAAENLLDNAVRYTPRGGTVTLLVTKEKQDFILRVTDTGPGFTAEALAKAGELLYTEAARSDTAHQGFGLYFARRVALSHSGTLRLSNTPGGCAELRLPICEQIEK